LRLRLKPHKEKRSDRAFLNPLDPFTKKKVFIGIKTWTGQLRTGNNAIATRKALVRFFRTREGGILVWKTLVGLIEMSIHIAGWPC
jgi:hypothetical protein